MSNSSWTPRPWVQHIFLILLVFVSLILAGCSTSMTKIFIKTADASADGKQFVGTYVRVKNAATGRYLSTKDGSVVLAARNATDVDSQEFFFETIRDGSGKPLFLLAIIEDDLRVVQSSSSFRMAAYEPRFENVIQLGKFTSGSDGTFLINQPVSESGPITQERLKVAWTEVDGKLSLENSRNPVDPEVAWQLWEIEVVSGSGPEHLHQLVGNWELGSGFHSNDSNSLTGIEIEEKEWGGLLKKYGWKGISMTFEDGFTVNCHGRNQVVQCTNGYVIPESDRDHFYLVDRIGNRDLIKRYIKRPQGYLLVHNGSAYSANTWGSWTEIGFGGKQISHVTPKTSLNALGTSSFLDVTDEKVFVIPARHRDLKIYVDPVDGFDRITTITNPPVDNSCYRIRGDLLSAEAVALAGDKYKYVDRDCKFSSNARRAAAAEEIKSSKSYQSILARVAEANDEGFFEDIDPDNLAHHKKVQKRILAPQSVAALAPQSIAAAVSTLNRDDDGKVYVGGRPEDNKGFSVNSMSIGGIETVEFIFGETSDGGVIVDLHSPAFKRNYVSVGGTFGLEAGATAGLVLGFWNLPVCEMTDGQSIGVGAEAVFDVGVGGTIWFGLGEHRPSGFTIALVFGLDGRAVTGQLVHTAVYKPSPLGALDESYSGAKCEGE